MKVEERLAIHLRDRGDQLKVPDASIEAVASAAAIRARRLRLVQGGAVTTVIGVIVLGGLLLMNLSSWFGELGNDDQPTRIVVSPYLDLSTQLGDQAGIELFVVTAGRPSYWRVATLESYGDGIWKTSGSFDPFESRLSGTPSPIDDGAALYQEVEVRQLNAIWVPVAPEPYEVLRSNDELTWSAATGSLTVTNDRQNSDGLSYSLVSNSLSWSPEDLRSATEADPEQVSEQFLQTGKGSDALAPIAIEVAATVTSGLTNRYDMAKALQDYFRTFDQGQERERDPNSDSDSAPVRVDGADPVEQLIVTRQGSAADFASAFALMARELGIPTRVAVGFTWGDPTSTDPRTGDTAYSVKGRHAHAWPEVYFSGIGWVPFEPTPGRGSPDAVAHTGVAAEQASNPETTAED